MNHFRFAHLADAHVGAWPRDLALRTALRESVLRALAQVATEKCDFLLIAGDLFHLPSPDPAEVAPIARALHRLNEQGIRIYAIFGSHDYVLHETSWLDVLSDGGLFVRVAPSPVLSEGKEWSLPWLTDEATGTVIAGISGRAQGLDTRAYESMNSEEFCRQKGFHIFLYHAAVTEFLPVELQGRVEGVPLARLPPKCGYYAGGHIHETYRGKGPGGEGVLVNPGATFGTSLTDLDKIAQGRTQAGIVIVDVADGVARPSWKITTEPSSIRIIDLEVQGLGVEEAVRKIQGVMDAPTSGAAPEIVIPRLHGERTLSFDVGLLAKELRDPGSGPAIHLDLNDLTTKEESGPSPVADPADVEGSVLSSYLKGDARLPGLSEEENLRRARLLLEELRRPPSSGESVEDYRRRVVARGTKILTEEGTEGGPGA